MRNVMSVPALLALGLCGMLAAQQPAPEQPLPAAKAAAAPAADAKLATAGAPVDPKAYIIGAEDLISIRVWHEPENSGLFVVRPDGKVSVPLVGEIQAAGLTPEKVSLNIAESLQRIMVHPEVTVGVEKVNSKKRSEEHTSELQSLRH